MNSLRILLVEDDPIAALDVEVLLSDLGYTLIATVDNGEAARKASFAEQPDLVILDIQLKGELTGLDVATLIAPLHIPIIFTTYHRDQATYEAASKAYSFGYLVKPFDKLTLQNSIEQAVKAIYSENVLDKTDATEWADNYLLKDRFLIKSNGIFHKVLVSDILYIKGDGNYSLIHTRERRFIVKISLKKMLEKLSPHEFVPSHKQYIVQLDKVDTVDTAFNQIAINTDSLPLGRHFKKEFLDRFQKI